MSIRQKFNALSLDKQVAIALGILSLVFGSFWKVYTYSNQPDPGTPLVGENNNPSDSAGQLPTINLHTKGTQNPAISSGGHVDVNFDNNPLPQQEKDSSDSLPSEPPLNVQQHTEGNQSPAINSSGDVNIRY